jgi:predicted lipid-binding transport protein (Tim44 family)
MNHQNSRRYEAWTQTSTFTTGRRAPRRNWSAGRSDLDHRANLFMETGLGRVLAALALGLLVGLGYTVIFGLSFFEGFLFMFLCSALSIGLNVFLKQDS